MNQFTEEYVNWLAGLKPGDRVALSRTSWSGGKYDLVTIERLTATQFVLPRGLRARRETGALISAHSVRRIQPITGDVRDAIEFYELKDWLSTLTLRGIKLSLNVLRAMKAAYDEEIAK